MATDFGRYADDVLAQPQLRDVATHDATASLPLDGMLYFFIGVDEPAYNIEHRVLYLTEDQTAAGSTPGS